MSSVIRSLFRAVTRRGQEEDVEKSQAGRLPPVIPPQIIRNSVDYPVETIEPSSQLTQFRLLVGIQQDKSFRAPSGWKSTVRPTPTVSSRPAPNVGIYTTVCDKEVKEKKAFKNFSALINACLALQLIVAAALTSIGAAGGSRVAVTVFGAINTVIAGFLTFLKGSGLPNRLRYFQHQWGHVREYIEQKERELMLGYEIDVHVETEHIRQMYQAVKDDVECSQPDRFVSAGNQTTAQQPKLTTMSIPNVASLQSRIAETSQTAREVVAQKAASSHSGFLSHLHEVGAVGKDLVKHGRQEAEEKVDHPRSTGASLKADVHELHTRLQDKINEVKRLEEEMKRIAIGGKAEPSQTVNDMSGDGDRVTATTAER